MSDRALGGVIAFLGVVVLMLGEGLRHYDPPMAERRRWWRLVLMVVVLFLGDFVEASRWFGSGLLSIGAGAIIGGKAGVVVGAAGMVSFVGGIVSLWVGLLRGHRQGERAGRGGGPKGRDS